MLTIKTNNFTKASILQENYFDNKHKVLLENNPELTDKTTSLVIAKLIKSIKMKYDKLEIEDIENSTGNFNRLRNKEYIVNSVSFLDNFNQKESNKDLLYFITTMNDTIKILTKPDVIKNFENAFQERNEFVKMIYTSVCLNLILACSSIIAFVIDYIKTPQGSYLIAFSKENHQDIQYIKLLIDNLKNFNDAFTSGKVNIIFSNKNSVGNLVVVSENSIFFNKKDEIKYNELEESVLMVIGTVGLIATSVVVAVLLLVNFMRFVIYTYYQARLSLGKYLEQQADFLEFNIKKLDSKNDKVIIARQEKVVVRLRERSAKIVGDLKHSTNVTKKEIKIENHKFEEEVKNEKINSNDGVIV